MHRIASFLKKEARTYTPEAKKFAKELSDYAKKNGWHVDQDYPTMTKAFNKGRSLTYTKDTYTIPTASPKELVDDMPEFRLTQLYKKYNSKDPKSLHEALKKEHQNEIKEIQKGQQDIKRMADKYKFKISSGMKKDRMDRDYGFVAWVLTNTAYTN